MGRWMKRFADGTAVPRIRMRYDDYGDHLKSEESIDVEGAGTWSMCTVAVIPAGTEARMEYKGPMVPGPWAFCTTHALVIDNHGGSAAEREAALKIELGETVAVDGLPGLWQFAKRDQTKLEGDGVKLVPVDDTARAVIARAKAHGELAQLHEWLHRDDVTKLMSANWRRDRAAAAIEELKAAGAADADVFVGRLQFLEARARDLGVLEEEVTT